MLILIFGVPSTPYVDVRQSMQTKMSNEDRILDFETLNATREALALVRYKRLETEVERILRTNKLRKAELHNRKDDQTTDYYKVDLADEDIESIASMFFDKESFSLGLNYETTRAASFYATMAEKWNQFLIED
jgi:hypothetical protein